nr:O-antigen ligase family protein [Plesiomonas shigelloides]
MNQIRYLASLLLVAIILTILTDAYIYEIGISMLGGFPLLNVIRLSLCIGVISFIYIRVDLHQKIGFLYFALIGTYLLSSFIFTNDYDKPAYYFFNFTYGYLLYLIIGAICQINNSVNITKSLFYAFSIFFILSVLIEFIPLDRHMLNDNALWQCGLNWNIRMCGATNNPNILGFVSFLMAAFSIICHQAKYKTYFLLSLVMSLLLVIMSLSRTATFSILLMLLLYFFSCNRGVVKTSIIISIALPLILTCLYLFHEQINLNLTDRFSLTSMLNASGRSDIFSVALDYFNESPLFGNGLDLNRNYITDNLRWSNFIDNAYLNILVSYGIIGIIFFSGMMAYIFKRVRLIGRAQWIIFISFLLMLTFEDYTFKGYYVWLLLFLINRNSTNNKDSKPVDIHI